MTPGGPATSLASRGHFVHAGTVALIPRLIASAATASGNTRKAGVVETKSAVALIPARGAIILGVDQFGGALLQPKFNVSWRPGTGARLPSPVFRTQVHRSATLILVSVVDRDNPFVRASHGDQCLFRLSRRG
jgi:hypothetical protein